MQDGIPSDSELNNFQVHCIAVPLQPEELALTPEKVLFLRIGLWAVPEQ